MKASQRALVPTGAAPRVPTGARAGAPGGRRAGAPQPRRQPRRRPAAAASAGLVVAAALALGSCRPASQPTSAPVSTPQVEYDVAPILQLAGVGQADEAPFYESSDYQSGITRPAEIIGHALGAQPAAPDRVIACFQTWAEQSARIEVTEYARSYEGRPLIRAVISTPENLARLDAIKADIARLADPRGLAPSEAERIIAQSPAIAWFGYSIHGNEVSGSDASLAFGHHLIASPDAVVKPLLENTIVIIDPVMNPDGRRRTLNAIEELRANVPNGNYASMERWRWPGGRGNHYLFDLNRDWLVGAHPETRGRWREILDFHPQLLIDAHEMGALDTYLFSPKNAPYNPSLPKAQEAWYNVFAAALAAGFDRRGWAYYTREWSDGWFPGYTTTWGPINGAISFLYEQASTRGLSLRRPSGTEVSYRDSIHGHAVSSLINLATLVENRQAVLRDYLAARQQAIAGDGRQRRVFAFRAGVAPERERALIEILMRQKIEVHRADADFTAGDTESSLGVKGRPQEFAAGTYLVFDEQPQAALVRALLDFDPRIDDASLAKERARLERENRTRIYDVTAWNLGQAFALDAYWITPPRVARTMLSEPPSITAGIDNQRPDTYAWIVDGDHDSAPVFAGHALEAGVEVHIADQAFATRERSFARGSVLIRQNDNPPDVAERVARAALSANAAVVAVGSGRAPGDGVDLGGRHFHRLERPRIALLANSPLSSNMYGHAWYHLDRVLRLPVTPLDIHSLGRTDLRRYNVIILTDASRAIGALLMRHKDALHSWIQQGGTLIAIGRSAAAVAKAELGISKVRLRADVLDQLPVYKAAATRSVDSRAIAIDSEAIWEGTGPASADAAPEQNSDQGDKKDQAGGKGPAAEVAKQREQWAKRFSPRGVMLRGLVDQTHWITAGLPEEMPILYAGDEAYLSAEPVRTAVRFASGPGLRLAGLLWPEARARLSHAAYLTVERVARGQVILFGFDPVFRALPRGSARLFSNAVVQGPGLGASQPLVW